MSSVSIFNPKLCGLESLPPEIYLSIMSHIPDLLSLHSLLCASPLAFHIFEHQDHGAKIFEVVLTFGYLPIRIQEVIRVVVLIRAGLFPLRTLDEFLVRFVGDQLATKTFGQGFFPEGLNLGQRWRFIETMDPEDHRDESAYYPEPVLPRTVESKLLRQILALSRQISYQTQACLQQYHSKFMTLKPQHLVDQSVSYHPATPYGPEGLRPYAWRRKPKGYDFAPIADLGPPSRTEELRVVKGFWWIRLFKEVKTTGAQSKLDWPDDDLKRLNAMDAAEFWKGVHGSTEDILSVFAYTRLVQADDMPNLKQFKKDRQTPAYHLGDHMKLRRAPPAWFYWFGHITSVSSPLEGVGFETFRSFGFGLWDEERMGALGLMPSDQSPRRGSNYQFAWRSILSEEEISQVERNLEAKLR